MVVYVKTHVMQPELLGHFSWNQDSLSPGTDAEPYVDGGTNFISLYLVIELGSISYTNSNY